MKKILPLILFTPLFSIGQSYKEMRQQTREFMKASDTVDFPKPFKFVYIDTITLDRNLIFSKCHQWLATNTSNYNIGLQMQDSLNGKLVIPNITSVYNSQYRYTLTVDVKSGKYRLTFSDFYKHKGDGYSPDIPFDTIAEIKMIYLGQGTKRQYWQAEKLHEKIETEKIFSSIKEFVRKSDDF